MTKELSWESDFNNKFEVEKGSPSYFGWKEVYPDDVKDFIRETLAKEKKALLEEITSGAGTADEAGHRAASILIKLKEMEGSD